MLRSIALTAASMFAAQPCLSQNIEALVTRQMAGEYCASRTGLPAELGKYADLMSADYGESALGAQWKEIYRRPLGNSKLRYTLYQSADETVAVFQGINRGTPVEWLDEFRSVATGDPSPAYRVAAPQITALARAYPNLSLIGHSKGGGLVQYLSSLTGVPGIAFDPEPSPLVPGGKSRVVNVSQSTDFLHTLSKQMGRVGKTPDGTSLLLNGSCNDIASCHSMTTLRSELDRLNKENGSAAGAKSRKCRKDAEQTAKTYACNVRGGNLATVVNALEAGKGLRFVNECIFSSQKRLWRQGENPAVIYICDGAQISGVAARIEDWHKTQGYAGEGYSAEFRTSVVQYTGDAFANPCVPACFGPGTPDNTGDISGVCHKISATPIPSITRAVADQPVTHSQPKPFQICLWGNCPK